MTALPDLAALDRADPLASFRDRFDLPDGIVYLDGNSLGPLPRETSGRIAALIGQEWGRDLIASWSTHGWIDLPLRVGAKIGRLIGAEADSVVAGESTSVNLFTALAAALALRRDRREIVSEPDNFPTDLYMAQGLTALLGQGHRIRTVPAEDIAAALSPDTAVLMLTQVNYRTGRMHDMAALGAAARAAGALAVWDLSHSAGAVPVDLARCRADFAVGCGYKFLNGGPGAPGYLYIAPRHQHAPLPLAGWMGHESPFAFAPDYRPAAGIARARVGTPPILGLAALEVGVDLALAADPVLVREKSLRMSGIFIDFVDRSRLGCAVVSPRDPARRGSQVCLTHPDAEAIMRRLAGRGVVGDFRPPDVMRFGIAPLSLRYGELGRALAALAAA